MFDNIGEKIKTLAEIMTWIGVIASIIGGIIIMEYHVALGCFVLIGGALYSWIASFVLYGFGQLVENSDRQAPTESEEGETCYTLQDENGEERTLSPAERLDRYQDDLGNYWLTNNNGITFHREK